MRKMRKSWADLMLGRPFVFNKGTSKGLHYILSWGKGADEAEVVMRGGGCCGRTRLR